MPEVDRQRVKQIFAEAIEKSSEQRASFVESACAGDAVLRLRVRRLLEMHDTAGEFLVEQTVGFGAARFVTAPGELVGDVIGNYKLVQLIGEGGFGTVYLAEQQQPVRRQVALKIIKLGMDTRQIIARFDAEKQALAMMDHPNIARVFDAGATDTGRPYFVMEYVQGVPITQFCDEHNLSPRQRLELFATVCAAVQHAHQKGIIHRDIKPSNVLVSMQDAKPVAKVIDFGIAKATESRLTEQTMFTEDRQLIGTPQYMSPEQADIGSRDIDTRADIYSLGVLLYELLAGKPPFEPERLRSAAFHEIQRIIREEDPPLPSAKLGVSKLAKAIRGDLDWIVMRAMDKDRTRRYETASGLAEDLRRHLVDEPIVARPPSTLYQLGKFARRNKALVGGIAAVIVVLSAGVMTSTYFAFRAQRERKVAVANRALAEQQRQVAENERQKAEAVTRFLTEDLLASASPEQTRGREVSVREMLDAASRQIQDQFANSPATEASVRSTLGQTYMTLGRPDLAIEHVTKALELTRKERGEDNPDTLTALNRLAGVYRATGKLSEAEPIYAQILAKRTKILGPEDRDTLTAMHNLAGIYRELGRFADALPLYQNALEICRRVLTPDDRQRLNAMEGLAGMYKDMGRYADAAPLYVEVLQIHREKLGEDHPQTMRTTNNLAVVLRQLGRRDESLNLYVSALTAQRKVLGADHPDTLATMTNLGRLYLEMNRLDDAVAVGSEALARSRKVLGDGHPKTLITMDGLAAVLVAKKRFDDAEKLLNEALERSRSTRGEDDVNTAMARHSLALLYLKTDRAAQAEPFVADALESARRALPEGHFVIGQFLTTQGHCLLMLNQFEEAESRLLESHEVLTAALGADHEITSDPVKSLVNLYEAWNKPEEAARWRAKLPAPK